MSLRGGTWGQCWIKVFVGPRLDRIMGPSYRHLPSHAFPTYIATPAYHLPLGKCEVANVRRYFSITGWITRSVISYVQDELATFACTTSQYRVCQISKRPLKNFANNFNNYRELLYKILHIIQLHLEQIGNVLLHYLQNWQYYVVFSRGNWQHGSFDVRTWACNACRARYCYGKCISSSVCV